MGINTDKASNFLGIFLVLVLLVMYIPDYIQIPGSQLVDDEPLWLGDDVLDVTPSYGGSNYVTTNFELSFFLPSGSRRDESYGLYIKQALAPLGIEVKIFAKPWGQFVGDLLRGVSTGKTFDMATVGFSGGGLTPDVAWLYSSEGYWGGNIMQLADPSFQAFQLQDTGLNQTKDIDPLIKAIDYELNPIARYELMEEFNDMYFTKLLWNMPLVAESHKFAMWKGFGGPINEAWDTGEGVIRSSFLGAGWNDADTPSQRVSNSSTIKWATNDQSKFNLDPFQVQDYAQGTQTDWSYVGGLLSFDKIFTPHPNVAWNWFSGDFGDTWDDDDNASTTEVPLTQYTYLLRDDVYWHETLDFEGNVVAAERVDGLDYNLTLTMYDMSRQTNVLDVNGIDKWKVLADWNISTTIFPNDTISIWVPNSLRTLNDVFKFGNLNPLPAHLLGGDLTYLNSSIDYEDYNMSSPLIPGMSFNPWDTYQWNSFESFEGNTAIGPYQMVDYEFNEYHSFAARSDYWYPNEWDVASFHTPNAGDPELVALENNFGVDLGQWGGSNTFPQDPYYHAWAEIAGNKEKPSNQNIEYIEYVVIDDHNKELIKFEAGDLDIFQSTQLGASTVASHNSNPDLVIKQSNPNESARLLIFNLLHDQLRKLNVRLAIAHVLDRDKLVNIHDGFGIPWWSVANPSKISNNIDWDTIQHPLEYDYAKARDLMRLEGYNAADTNDFIPTADIPDINDIVDVSTTLEDMQGFENNLQFKDYFGIGIGFVLIAIIVRKGLNRYS
ncbi:MAG: hypothetical protein GPJ54_03200 [Candidatus Heimdallarchaeota archaeon]|nr:hypothetical protein [Candidatus Heimdallarchaeota archaeon]